MIEVGHSSSPFANRLEMAFGRSWPEGYISSAPRMPKSGVSSKQSLYNNLRLSSIGRWQHQKWYVKISGFERLIWATPALDNALAQTGHAQSTQTASLHHSNHSPAPPTTISPLCHSEAQPNRRPSQHHANPQLDLA